MSGVPWVFRLVDVIRPWVIADAQRDRAYVTNAQSHDDVPRISDDRDDS